VLADHRGVVVEATDDAVDVGLDRAGQRRTDVPERDQRRGAHPRAVVVGRQHQPVDERRHGVGVVRGDVRQHLRRVAPGRHPILLDGDRRRLHRSFRRVGELGGEVRQDAKDPRERRPLRGGRKVDQRLDQRLGAARISRDSVRNDVDGHRADRPATDHERHRLSIDRRVVAEPPHQPGSDLRARFRNRLDDPGERDGGEHAPFPLRVEVGGEPVDERSAVLGVVLDDRDRGVETGPPYRRIVVCQPALDRVPDGLLPGDAPRRLDECGQHLRRGLRSRPGAVVDVRGDRRGGRRVAHEVLLVHVGERA